MIIHRIWYRFWRDKDGNVVIFQPPNPPLYTWFIAHVLSIIFEDSPAHRYFAAMAIVAIIIWSLLEIINGVTYFRKLLGTAIFLAVFIRIVG